MDPEETLKLVSIFIHKGSRASGWRAHQYFNDAGEHLETYWDWRKRGGFEPSQGDARARRLGEELSSAWEKHESEEQRERDVHEENPQTARAKKKKPWIKREGKLGGPGYATKPARTRHQFLNTCVDEYGYRSCLGSIQALLRNTELSATVRKNLQADSNWLVKKYGGEGSFENPHEHGACCSSCSLGNPCDSGCDMHDNPHWPKGLKLDGVEVYDKLNDQMVIYWRADGTGEKEFNRALSKYGSRHDQYVVQGVTNDGNILIDNQGGTSGEIRVFESRNPYQGDAFELARYRKEREEWERRGRRGPPPVPPSRRRNPIRQLKNKLLR